MLLLLLFLMKTFLGVHVPPLKAGLRGITGPVYPDSPSSAVEIC